MAQQGDVLLFQSLDGGNVAVNNGLIEMTTGLETAVYLSMFSPDEWFLNDIAESSEEILYSETEQVIKNKANVSANYALLEQAVNDDLKWLVDDGYALSLSVGVSSDAINYVSISIQIDQLILNFNEGWDVNVN